MIIDIANIVNSGSISDEGLENLGKTLESLSSLQSLTLGFKKYEQYDIVDWLLW